MADRGRDTSNALTEVRTALSRAENALEKFERGPTELRHDRSIHDPDVVWTEEYDPDHAEMVDALNKVVDLLDPWRRTGRKSQ